MSRKQESTEKDTDNQIERSPEAVSVTENSNAHISISGQQLPDDETILQSYNLTMHEETKGPIPSPKFMRGYYEMDKSFPDRIIRMSERELEHQINMDNANTEMRREAMKKGFASGKRGQWLGASLGLILIAASVFLAMNGHDNVAMMMIGTGLATVVGAFVKDIFKK